MVAFHSIKKYNGFPKKAVSNLIIRRRLIRCCNFGTAVDGVYNPLKISIGRLDRWRNSCPDDT